MANDGHGAEKSLAGYMIGAGGRGKGAGVSGGRGKRKSHVEKPHGGLGKSAAGETRSVLAKAHGINSATLANAENTKLDAHRKASDTLRLMQQRGELGAGRGGNRRSRSQLATVKLENLGLTRSQSSRYRQGVSVLGGCLDQQLG